MQLISRILSVPFLILIWIYQKIISPWFPNTCRYTPSCSEYAKQSFEKHGPFKGFWLTIRRVGTCHPWGGSGYDPVP